MADSAPYQAEYAKSGRASCKACKNKIDQGALRIAVMVQSAFFDGKQPNWHHEECFFKKQRPKAATDIANFNKLRPADQKRIKGQIGIPGPAPVEEGKGKKKGKKRAVENPGASLTDLRDFNIEYAKSSRSSCRHCEIKICKGEVRVSKTVYDTEIGMKYGGQPLWHHLACFAKEKASLLYFAGAEDLNGFKSLSKEDQELAKKELVPLAPDEIQIKKLKDEPKDEAELTEEKDLEKKLEKQNKLFHKHKDALKPLKKEHLNNLLEHNSQETFAGKDQCLDHLVDCMMFGVLQPCPECKEGQLVLDDYGYKCTGNISQWTKCSYTTQDPKRSKMTIPATLKNMDPFTNYKGKVSKRVFPAPPPAPFTVVLKKEDPESGPSKIIPIPPLKNLQFFIQGISKEPTVEIKNRILKMGGLVVSKLTETLAAVVSTKAEVEKMSKKMTSIEEADVEVVEPAFFDLIDRENGTVEKTLQLIKEHNIASWGSDPIKRVPQDVIDGKSIQKSGSMYVKSSGKSTKLKIKGGTAVDPDSGLQDVAHVYIDGAGRKYTVVLTKTDLVAQKNSYYKIQLLEAVGTKKYWLFRSWGRIGTKIGNKKTEDFSSNLDGAIFAFEELFLEKTQNEWGCGNYIKYPELYYPVDVDYCDAEEAETVQADQKCSLPKPVQELIIRIFDKNTMKRTLVEYELDTDKMPLGKLSKKQIKSGYSKLTELLQCLGKSPMNKSRIIDCTNMFYTLIPHAFGVDNPPLLDNIEAINKKKEMLDNLLEIEIAYSLLKTDTDDKSVSPVEAHYLKLKAQITPLEPAAPDYELIQRYLTNTHAATHSNYTLQIHQVFKVVRDGEEKRFKPFLKVHNRRLLWHGSRVTNFAGILSQGLRIAPPEAPVTGYMFGKGIYFADMVSKSANYCCTSKSNPIGVLLLCEVALGDMKKCYHAENVTRLEAGKSSVWGVGRTQPDPSGAALLPADGAAEPLLVPCGRPLVDAKLNSSLLYNEFIVYDVAQVRVKYLLEVKFNYLY